MVSGSGSWTLGELHPLVDNYRSTGNGYYLSSRLYSCGHVELVATKLNREDALHRGGGAKRKNKDKSECTPEVLDRSRRRAKTTVRRKCLALGADRILTLTFRENLTDIDEAYRVFKYFNKLMRKRFGDRYSYVAVPEYQKRGAVHFHLAVKGFYPVKAVRPLWHRAVGAYGGNVDITDPKKYKGKNSWNPKNVGGYIAKYVTKNDIAGFNKKRYSSGGKIVLPEPQHGWLPLGVPVVSVMVNLVSLLTRKRPGRVWESAEYDGLLYLST